MSFSIEDARAHRAAKARALAELRDGSLALSDVLRRPPDALTGTPLFDVLVACRGLGPTGARRICESAQVWPLTIMGELYKFQRQALLAALPPRAR